MNYELPDQLFGLCYNLLSEEDYLYWHDVE